MCSHVFTQFPPWGFALFSPKILARPTEQAIGTTTIQLKFPRTPSVLEPNLKPLHRLCSWQSDLIALLFSHTHVKIVFIVGLVLLIWLGIHFSSCGYENFSLQLIDCVREGEVEALGRLEGFWQHNLATFVENGGINRRDEMTRQRWQKTEITCLSYTLQYQFPLNSQWRVTYSGQLNPLYMIINPITPTGCKLSSY